MIDAKKPEASILVKAINHKEDWRMPPSPSPKLSDKDIATLTNWIKAGIPGIDDSMVAKAPATKGSVFTPEARNYWAYKPVVRPDTPVVKNKEWVRNPIDAFILTKLEDKGLSPAPAADSLSMVRRVYYDLIGLPPTPEEVDAYLNDKSENKYEALIEKLLASPHYGEKWARHWLDLVRFAETNGFEFDQNKPYIWRYRDYVIDAFNKDKPYDQFMREQIAGDRMNDPTPETLIATGYYRLNQYDTGAADRNLQKYEALDSILSTTGQVFLGMSIGCARCHDHKADPITHRDYYTMLAFFHNFTDLSGAKTRPITAQVPGASQGLAERQERESAMARQVYQFEQHFAVILAQKKGIKVSDLASSDLSDLKYRFYSGKWDRLPEFDGLIQETDGRIASNHFSLAPAVRAESLGLVFDGKLNVQQAGEHIIYLECRGGMKLEIDGKPVFERLVAGEHAVSEMVTLRNGLLPVRLEYFTGNDKPALKVAWSGPGFERRSLTDEKSTSKTDLAAEIKKHGLGYLSEEELGIYNRLIAELNQSRKAPKAAGVIEVSAVTESGSNPTHVLIRGNPKSKGERVDPAFPEVLVPGGKQTPVTGGRLALANWLADPANPLPARVMMNRLWQQHFGRAIVPSPNDFGKFGEQPTHPELLDWLASEFVAKGWKIKDMHRLIMTSNAYRMSSKGDKKALAVDGANMLFWRYNMRRLTSDELRDSMLMVSGKLNLKMGGPSVYPPIPREVLAGQARPGQGWKVSSPEEASRRSVYVFTKRSLLVPILANFDQADTDQSCPIRFTTTVPTQALALMNDQFSNDHAKLFAQRLMKEVARESRGASKASDSLDDGTHPWKGRSRQRHGLCQRLSDAAQLERTGVAAVLLLDDSEYE